jgi:hypothetical protein
LPYIVKLGPSAIVLKSQNKDTDIAGRNIIFNLQLFPNGKSPISVFEVRKQTYMTYTNIIERGRGVVAALQQTGKNSNVTADDYASSNVEVTFNLTADENLWYSSSIQSPFSFFRIISIILFLWSCLNMFIALHNVSSSVSHQ